MKNPAKEPRLVGLNPLFWGDLSAELLKNFKIYRTDIRARRQTTPPHPCQKHILPPLVLKKRSRHGFKVDIFARKQLCLGGMEDERDLASDPQIVCMISSGISHSITRNFTLRTGTPQNVPLLLRLAILTLGGGGGFKCFLFSPLFGDWVETTN